jgi:predicted Fe-Mo cluster-binding NifX family protein
MNLLIPTDDGISIAPDFEHAHNFRVITVSNGSVTKDEIRVIKESVEKEFHQGISSNAVKDSGKTVKDFSRIHRSDTGNQYVVIANNISKKSEKKLHDNNFVFLPTMETNIINAIIHFIKYHMIQESDYCCFP